MESAIAAPTRHNEQNDAELVELFKSGFEEAFDAIVVRYQDRIYQFACRLVGDPEEASDVAQDAFVRAYGKLGGFRNASGLYTWLYKITLNIGLNVLRKRKLRTFIRLSEPSTPQLSISASQDTEISQAELRSQIEEAIADLPPKQRAIFILRQYDELSHREIAGIVGSSEGAVRAGYFHAVRKLQSSLGDVYRLERVG
jgi:RNA polymerase sigma-70 factor (ECF subfamily)